MGLFRRTPRGKHALGAAVTGIPSRAPAPGPLPVADLPFFPDPSPLPVADLPVVPEPVLVAPTPAPLAEDLYTSVSALLETGEAWAAPAVAHDPCPEPPPAAPVGALSALEAALTDLLPTQERRVQPGTEPERSPVVPVALPRVQLGFRDGTSTGLDPDSESFAALQHLAQSLTSRD